MRFEIRAKWLPIAVTSGAFIIGDIFSDEYPVRI